MMKKLILLLMAMCLVSVASANTVWNPAANGITPPAVGDFGDPCNWTNGVPVTDPCLGDTKGVFNVPGAAECQVTDAQVPKQLVQGDGGPGGVLRVMSGGTVTTGASWTGIGYNDTAHLIVDAGGAFNFGQHAWIGQNAGGVGTVDISGDVSVAAMLGIGWNGGVGTVNVKDGGTLDLFQLHGDGISSIKAGSVLNIETGGEVYLPGDYTAVVNAYIDNGCFASDGVVGAVLITVDGNTTLTAIPEPATMILLGLGGLLIRRKK